VRSFLNIKILLIASALLAGCTGEPASGCNPQLEVCDFPSRTEIAARAELAPIVVTQRRLLGTWWNKTHERLIESYSYNRIDYSCVEEMLVTHRGNFNAALCMPAWMRGVPPSATLTFRRIETNTRTKIYLVSMENIYRYRWYRYH